MNRYVALLRAVNVGGHGKLAMSALTQICQSAGFGDVRTYIASGNVVFDSDLGIAEITTALQNGLRAHTGAEVPFFLRTGAQMQQVYDANPFAGQPPNRVAAIFLDGPPPAGAADTATGARDEEIALGVSEIYVHYPSGMGTSRLKLRAGATGTARNMNTVLKLVQMASTT